MPYVVCISNPTVLYAGGVNIYKSTNSGSSWQGPYGSFGGGKVLSIAASSTGTDTVYAGILPVGSSVAAVYRTVNAGTTWTDVSNGMVPNRYPTRIHVNQYNSKEVYVTFGGFGTAHVIKSTNAGTSWTNITGNLPDIPAQSICIDPVYNNLYLGNDLGMYVSTNGGTNWIVQYPSITAFLGLQFIGDSIGYAVGTTGTGIIYKTSNGGTNWTTIHTFSANPIRDLSFVNKDLQEAGIFFHFMAL